MVGALLRSLGITLVVCLFLSSCRTIGGQPSYPILTKPQLDERIKAFDKATIDDCMKTGADFCRDQIITSQLDVIDDVYGTFQRAVSTASGTVDISGDLLAAAASAASTVTGGTQAKNILSAIATVITGGKASIDKNLFLQQSAHVLLGRMDALRAKALIPIREGLLQPAAKYPLWWAVRDVRSYMAAGSFGAAITDIELTSGMTKNTAEVVTQSIIKEQYGADNNTKTLRKFWMPDGNSINTDNEAALKSEMMKLKIDPGVDIALFLNAKRYAEARATAVKDLNLTK